MYLRGMLLSARRSFRNCDEAISAYGDMLARDADLVLIKLPDVNLWSIMSTADCAEFIKHLPTTYDEKFMEDPLRSATRFLVTPYQICLWGKQRQKFTFVHLTPDRSEETADRVRRLHDHTRRCFGSDARLTVLDDRVEITVPNAVNNIEDAHKHIEMLTKYLESKQIEVEILPPVVNTSKSGVAYTEHAIINSGAGGVNAASDSIQEILAQLKHVTHLTINIGMIGNGTINGGANFNTPAPDLRAVAERWITLNPPNDRERSSAYFARYLADNPRNVAIQVFSKLCAGLGYCKKQDKRGAYWHVE
jgi:hypothetical protein